MSIIELVFMISLAMSMWVITMSLIVITWFNINDL